MARRQSVAVERRDRIPDVRDGLTRIEREILRALDDLQQEFGGRSVPTITLWGVLIERGVNLSQDELNDWLTRLGAREAGRVR